MPDGIHESDLVCQSSDTDVDFDKCLESNDEQIISSLITIKHKNDKRIKFKVCNICIIVSCVVRPVIQLQYKEQSQYKHWFEPRYGQIKDYEIDICCFSAKHAA
jgi:hypothetical protein